MEADVEAVGEEVVEQEGRQELCSGLEHPLVPTPENQEATRPDHHQPLTTYQPIPLDLSKVGNNGTTESSPAVSLRLSEEAGSVSMENENGKELSEEMEQQVKVHDEELGVADEEERRENGNGSHQQNGDVVDGNGDSNVISDGNGESNGNGEEKSPEQSDSDSSSSSSSSSSSEEEMVFTKTLRRRPVDLKEEQAKQERALLARITKILKKEKKDWTDAEGDVVDENPRLVEEVLKRVSKRKKTVDRKREVEDAPDVLYRKCVQLAKAIERAKNLVVYTGAGVSTAANIPDYRGPQGVWTLLDQGVEVPACNLEQAEPTFTHMALFTLYRKGKLKHIVSQNCDGLHLRSGIPRYALSEVHGNMFIEICKHCRPMRPFVRLFDVTERTNKGRHTTMRRCYVCGNSLYDTIVHFGEKGQFKWPINWQGATKAADKADVVLCLGSSLQVLRRYPWLWCMDRPPRQRPKLFIVNLQWTPKDSAAKVKLNGKCDDVMRNVMAILERKVPDYHQPNDPIFTYATPLNDREAHTSTRTNLVVKRDNEEAEERERDIAKDALSKDHPYASPERKGDPSPPRKRPRRSAAGAAQAAMRGKFVEGGEVSYRHMKWARDALYLSYQPFFEYIDEDRENVGVDAFCCDCCDPAKKREAAKKRRRRSQSESDSEEEDEDDEDGEEGNGGEDPGGGDENGKSSVKKEIDEDGVKQEVKEEGDNGAAIKTEVKAEIKQEVDTPEASDGESVAQTASSGSRYPVNQPGWFGKGRKKRLR